MLGDCWLLSTCAAIAKKEELLYKVIDPGQVLHGPGYTGLIQVRLWRYGHWVTVFIDDRSDIGVSCVTFQCSCSRLPQKKGNYCYARCYDENEFWVALIEKAYAKIHGSYEGIEGGMPIEAMVDLTGGLAERYELRHADTHRTLYKYLRKSFASQVQNIFQSNIFHQKTFPQAFITCSRKGDWRHSRQADKNGLVQGNDLTLSS